MASPNLPTNIASGGTLAGQLTHADIIHRTVNAFDTDIDDADVGDVPIWDGTVYAPGAVPHYEPGLIGDGTTNESAAFVAAYAAVVAARDSSQSAYFGSNWRGKKVINLPPGTFKIVSPGALMSDLGIVRTAGLVIRGAGRDMTNIVFSPSTANQYLMDNNDDWLHVTFEDLTFHSTVSTASFMKSTSSGGAQNYVFNRVNWTGTWKYGIDLQGNNTNSEMTWFHCGIYSNWTTFLYSGLATGSDQFLNYNFFSCQVEYTTGTFIEMALGGNINIWGGSFIHGGDGSAEQIFFKLSSGDHGSGVQRLFVAGVRFEHRHTLSRLIKSDWKRGSIHFLSCDMESQVPLLSGSENVITGDFIGVNNTMPLIVFDNCMIQGRHRYTYETDSFPRQRRIVYRNCEFPEHTSAHSFLDIVANSGHGNLGSAPPVVFENCRTGAVTESAHYPFDCVVNWEKALNAQPRERRVSIKNANGALLDDNDTPLEVWLPLNAVITNVRFYKPNAGSSASTTYTYVVKTSEVSPTTVATANPGTIWSGGFNVSVDTWFICDSEAKRQLKLTATNIDQTSPQSLCIVTYLA